MQNTDWTTVGVLVAGIAAVWLQYRILQDTVIKNLREDRDAWKAACERKDKIIEHQAASTRTAVEAAEKLVRRDEVA